VNLPGSFASLAAAIVSFQTVPAIFGSISDFTGGPPNSTLAA